MNIDTILLWTHLDVFFLLFIFLVGLIDSCINTYLYLVISSYITVKYILKRLFIKFSLIFAVLIIGIGVGGIIGNVVGESIIILTKVVVFIYPSIDVLRNISIITNGKFPPTALINKLSNIYKTLKIKK